MKESQILEIINSCRDLDVSAFEVYDYFSGVEEFDEETKAFWKNVAEDERKHIMFWEKVEEFFLDDKSARLFENPHAILNELRETGAMVATIKEKSRDTRTIAEALLIAFSLEIHLLHPVFELFFQYMREPLKLHSPSKTYTSHINKFFNFASKHGQTILEVGIFENIMSRLLKTNKELALCTQLDPMTLVYNRRGLFSNMEILSHLAKRNGNPIGLITADIDDFKKVNDTFGHQKGDEVITGVANILKKTVRRSDIVGRLGGEEFLVFLPDTNPENLKEVAEKIRVAISEETKWGVSVTVSIGAVCGVIAEDPVDTLENMLIKADQHLYAAKCGGKNAVSSVAV